VRLLGLVDYERGLALQTEALAQVDAGDAPGIVLGLRHPPTVTLGRRTAPEELRVTPDELARRGIGLFRVDRGGGATFHYPDQAVVYPILDIERLRLRVPDLLDRVRDALLDTLATFGVAGIWAPDRPGVYVGGAKIASVGLHLSRGRTTHGVALNVGQDWDGFDLIDPCKMRGLPITSIADLTGVAPHPDSVCEHLACGIARRC
jgi:lipoate-protein ligase B